jgi:hypothetical protein
MAIAMEESVKLTSDLLGLLSASPTPHCISLVNAPSKALETVDPNFPLLLTDTANAVNLLCTAVLVFASSVESAKNFSEISYEGFSPHSRVFLVLDVAGNSSDAELVLSSKSFASSINTVVIIPDLRSEGRSLSIFTHDVTNSGKAKLINSWRNGQFITDPFGSFFKESLRNLHGRTLRISTFHYEPFVGIYTDEDGKETYGGIEVNLTLYTIHGLVIIFLFM